MLNMIKDDKGNTSMMRVSVLAGIAIGSILCLAGIGAVYMELPESQMIQTGGILMMGGGFAKALQKKFES